jgi:cell surface protein SprA
MGVPYLGSAGDPAKGNVTPANMYGADVMIPAFLAAYTGGGTTRELNIFPSLARMLPNWTLTYKGLSNLPFIRDYFKSVTVSHGYKSVYAVGSYNSYASWMEFMNGTDLGFTQSQATGAYSPSSCYDISTVSINESFAPLIGFNFTFHNNMTLKAEYRTTRVMSLSITSAQLTETGSRDFVLGWEEVERFTDFATFDKVVKQLGLRRIKIAPSDGPSAVDLRRELAFLDELKEL